MDFYREGLAYRSTNWKACTTYQICKKIVKIDIA